MAPPVEEFPPEDVERDLYYLPRYFLTGLSFSANVRECYSRMCSQLLGETCGDNLCSLW